jgi:hypothetical protein
MPPPTGRIEAPAAALAIPPAPRLFRGEVPRKRDLTPYRLPRYRGQLIGCCVGESGAATAETTTRTPEPLADGAAPLEGRPFSPLWVYHQARQYSREQGMLSFGEGAIVTHALAAIARDGLVAYDAWPATTEAYRSYRDGRVPQSARDAKKWKPTGEPRRLEGPDQVLEFLGAGYSVWIGVDFPVNSAPDASGYFAWRGARGGHAVEVLGYDLDADRCWIGNSWDNARWGKQPGGIAWTKWSDLADGSLSARALQSGRSEAVVLIEVEGGEVRRPTWLEVLDGPTPDRPANWSDVL